MPMESSEQTNTSTAFRCRSFPPCAVRIKSKAKSQAQNNFLVCFSPVTISLNSDMRQMLDWKTQLSVSNESGTHILHCAASPFLYTNSCASQCLMSWGCLCHDVAIMTMISPIASTIPSLQIWSSKKWQIGEKQVNVSSLDLKLVLSSENLIAFYTLRLIFLGIMELGVLISYVRGTTQSSSMLGRILETCYLQGQICLFLFP